jgi:uncharacterized protein YacL
MSRFIPELLRRFASFSEPLLSSASGRRVFPSQLTQRPAVRREFWLVRVLLLVSLSALGYALGPFGVRGVTAVGAGVLLALAILLAELRLRRTALSSLLGGAFGGTVGLFAALLVTLVISRAVQVESTKSFLALLTLFAFGYLGLALGSERGGELREMLFSRRTAEKSASKETVKLLDTSVLIDGRIADICDAQFLDGVLAVPQFVLHELQLVADSSDSLKRQRGRRGLGVLQRMQKMPQVEVRILDDDTSPAGEVDHKLVELARRIGAKIVTNDFNLNKVATVQGLSVLNVNQLANALKPAVLPGEPMRVLILREGKEPNQGVAYLEDGTMVVVDGARRMINKSADVIVTSVHQTTAGKMIFGRLDERGDSAPTPGRQAAAAGAGGRPDGAGRLDSTTRLPEPPLPGRLPRTIFPEPDAD